MRVTRAAMTAIVCLLQTMKPAASTTGIFTAIVPRLIVPNSTYTIWVSGDPNGQDDPPPVRFYLDCERRVSPQAEPAPPILHSRSQNFPIAQFLDLTSTDTKNATIRTDQITTSNFASCSVIAAHLRTGEILDRTQLTLQTEAQKSGKSLTIFVQTDKPAYQPEHTVRMRFIILNENFLPTTAPVNVTIRDAKNIKVRSSNSEEWPADFVQNDNGIKKFKYRLASSLNLGTWTVTVESGGVQESLTFVVEKYVLPKFLVKIIPTVRYLIKGRSSSLTVEVSASYTYGKSLVGNCSVVFYDLRRPPVKGQENPRKGVLTNGRLFMGFSAAEAGTYRIVANVTESKTGRWTLGTLDYQVYTTEPYEITWLNPQKTYKPGYPLNIQLAVATLDNLPVSDPQDNAITIRSMVKNPNGVFEFESPGSSIPANGIVNIPLSVPQDPSTTFHSLTVHYKSKSLSLAPPKAFNSASKVILEIWRQNSPLTAGGHPRFLRGNSYNFSIRASGPILNRVNYILWSGRTMIDFQVAQSVTPNDQPVQQGTLEIRLPQAAYTQLTVLVFFVHRFGDAGSEKEIVSASTTWATNNYIDLQLSSERLEPAQNISMTFQTHPGSTIGLRAVDQSVLLLKSGDKTHNDVDPKRVPFNALWSPTARATFYSSKSSSSGPSTVSNFMQEFENLGLTILSNGGKAIGRSKAKRSIVNLVRQPDVDLPGGVAFIASVDEIRTRTEFPEVWLWEEISAENETQVFQPKIPKIPDTITSWFITAFSLNRESGLAVTSFPKILQVFRPFFVTLNLPYSAIKHETFDLQVIVHNYMGEDIFAEVTFFNVHDNFQFVDTNERAQINVTKMVLVPNQQVEVVKFVVTPLRLGMLDIAVQGVTEKAGDAIIRQLRVIAPGEKYAANQYKRMIQPRQVGQNGVPEHTERILTRGRRSLDSRTLKFSGDTMTPILNLKDQRSVRDMIGLPSGCGEQSMTSFFPNILALDYLRSLGKLTPDIEAAGKHNLRTGYSLQLRFYDKTKGSFKYHIDRSVTSTWLTAFILRCFAASRKYIPSDIDDQVLINGMKFLVRQQNVVTGEFLEHGRSLYPQYNISTIYKIAGGLERTEVIRNVFRYGLTAYVTLALIEVTEELKNDLSRVERMSIDEARVKGLRFISSAVALEDSDAYSLALITTCLHAAGHDAADRFYAKLQRYKKTSPDGTLVHYESSETTTEAATTPLSIEITGYALMANLWRSQQSIGESLPIVKWLLSKRNARGGFVSTQDTVVGLTALSMYARKVIGNENEEFNIIVRTNNNDTSEYRVNRNNSILLEDFIVPPHTQWIDIIVRGNGRCFMEYEEVHYRSKRGVDESQFKIKAKWVPTTEFTDEGFNIKLCLSRVEDDDIDEFEVQLIEERKIWCASANSTAPGSEIRRKKWCEVTQTGDVVATVDLPSGYAFVEEELDRIMEDESIAENVKNVEPKKQGTQAIVYYDYIRGNDTCIDLPVSRLYSFVTKNKASISVVEYMDPSHKGVQQFDPAVKKTVCDLCLETNECDLIRKCADRRRR